MLVISIILLILYVRYGGCVTYVPPCSYAWQWSGATLGALLQGEAAGMGWNSIGSFSLGLIMAQQTRPEPILIPNRTENFIRFSIFRFHMLVTCVSLYISSLIPTSQFPIYWWKQVICTEKGRWISHAVLTSCQKVIQVDLTLKAMHTGFAIVLSALFYRHF